MFDSFTLGCVGVDCTLLKQYKTSAGKPGSGRALEKPQVVYNIHFIVGYMDIFIINFISETCIGSGEEEEKEEGTDDEDDDDGEPYPM